MVREVRSGGRFIVGAGALADVGQHAANLGKTALVLGGTRAVAAVQPVLETSLRDSELHYHITAGEHVKACGHVALACLLHALANPALQVFVLCHARLLVNALREPHACAQDARRTDDRQRPEESAPLCPREGRAWAGRRGSRAERRGMSNQHRWET